MCQATNTDTVDTLLRSPDIIGGGGGMLLLEIV